MERLRGAAGGGAGAKGRVLVGLVDLAQGLMIEASLARTLGQGDEARLVAETARRIVVDVDQAPRWWLAHVDELLALIEADQGDLAGAEERLGRAVATKRQVFGETRPAALALLALGGVQERQGETDAAIATMRQGVSILAQELRRSRGVGSDRLATFLAAGLSQARLEPGNADALYREMLEVSQLTGSSATAKAVSQTAARLAAGDPATEALVRAVQDAQRQRDEARLDLGRLMARPATSRKPGQVTALQEAFRQASHAADRLQARLEREAPHLAGLMASRLIKAGDLIAALRPGEGLVRYVLGARRGFALLVRADGRIAVEPLGLNRGEIDDRVRHLRQAFTIEGGAIRPFDMAAAHELYKALLAPLEPALAGLKHLHVVASDGLLSLPFAVLVTEPPPPGPEAYGQAAWLVQRLATSTAISVQSFHDLRQIKGRSAPKPFIGFGDATFQGGGQPGAATSQCRQDEPMDPALLRGLVPLPGTAVEVQRVAHTLGAGPGSIHLGPAMAEPALRRQPLSDYQVVYFATHGLLPGELMCQSEPALALSPPHQRARNTAADGLLEASEIAELSLKADLVVLSACNTAGGSGKFGGEALSGLTRAFFFAGARGLLVSHWVVESEAAVDLMSDLFKRRHGLDTAEALRQAQTAMIHDPRRTHPFFWGPFTLAGEG